VSEIKHSYYTIFMARYSVRKIDSDDQLIDFWSDSPDATIFTHPGVLPKLIDQIEWWMASRDGHAACLWPVCGSDFRDGGSSRFAYYVGPMWSSRHKKLSPHRWFEYSGRIYSEFLEQFNIHQLPVVASLDTRTQDIRHFLWQKSLDSNSLNVDVIPRYTAILALENEFSGFPLNAVSTNRRRDINKIHASDTVQLIQQCDFDQIIELYRLFYLKKGVEVNPVDERKVRQLCELVTSGFGFFNGYTDKITGKLIAYVLLLADDLTANMVLNQTHPDYISTGIGSAVIYDSIVHAKLRGCRYYDFNGANSYSSAFYKHSFDAQPVLYFDLKFNWPVTIPSQFNKITK